MFKALFSMDYTTTDSEDDDDYDPTKDADYGNSTDSEEYKTDEEEESSSDEKICFQNIIDEKDKEISELKRMIKQLRQILKSKLNI